MTTTDTAHPNASGTASTSRFSLGNIAIFGAFLLMFFCSGASALMYEVVWTRSLSLIFGVTLHAISAVLASFMGGMAIGSYVVGRMADRARHPLLVYGLMEAGIGVSALASLWAIHRLPPLYVALYNATGGSEWLVTLVRFLAACAVMLVPTALMGATLPFMVRASLVHLSKVGENISLLYALNTAGAASGALLAGFVLVGSFGLNATAQTGAAINVGIGVVALALAAITRRQAEAATAATANHDDGPVRRLTDAGEPGATASGPSRWVPTAVLVGMGVSGFCALAYEVIWFRILNLFLNGTSYAFTVMLVTFLVGLAVGSALTRLVIGRLWNWAAVLGLLQFGVGVICMIELDVVPKLPIIRDALVNSSSPLLGRPVFAMGTVSGLLLFPLALLLGMTFPVAAQALAKVRGKEGEHIASLNASNTLGAIGGSLAGGLVLVPLIGSQTSMTLLATINLLMALMLVGVALAGKPQVRIAVPALAVVFLALFVTRNPDIYPEMYANLFKDHKLLWHEEGIENTVSVFRHPEGYKIMYLDSREQAYDHPAPVRYHQLIGSLGMIVHPDPKDVLVIGLGGGATPGAVVPFKDSNVDVVELSPSVVRAAIDNFGAVNNDIGHQKNAHIMVDDGRNYLMLTKKKYDVITADIIQPIHAGSANLYSREYFELAKSALKDDGVMVQWINPGLTQIYPIIARTFAEVFPGAQAWYNGSLVVGSRTPVSPERLAQILRLRLGNPEVQKALVPELDFGSPESAIRNYYNTLETVLAKLPAGPILTDDRPLTEYFRSIPDTDDSIADLSKPQ